jgi:hypothetical protein
VAILTSCGGDKVTKEPEEPRTTPTPVLCHAGGPYQTFAEQPITFNGSASTSPNGISAYDWNFGDETTGTGVTPTHTYKDFSKSQKATRDYDVTLRITDRGGATATCAVKCKVTNLY